jgi:hypothetical protein
MHVVPPAQRFPHEPQFALSVCVSTQLMPAPDGHARVEPVHAITHEPALHI